MKNEAPFSRGASEVAERLQPLPYTPGRGQSFPSESERQWRHSAREHSTLYVRPARNYYEYALQGNLGRTIHVI